MASRLRTLMQRNWAHLRARPVRLAIAAGALALGAMAGMPAGNAAFVYTWQDARFCDDCHVHDYANRAFEASAHAGLTTCHDCHRVPIRHYPRNLWVTVKEGEMTEEEMHRPHIPVIICAQCHLEHGDEEPLTGPMTDELRAQIVKIDSSPLHKVHLEAEERSPGEYLGGTEEPPPSEAGEDEGAITCMDCHGSATNRAHRFEATTSTCLQCHGGQELDAGRLQGVSCRECHLSGFLPAELPVDEGPKAPSPH